MPLAREVEPSADQLWETTVALVERVGCADEAHERVGRALDAIVDLLGADRGLLLLTPPEGGEVVLDARSAAGALPTHEREEISRSLVRRARDTGKLIYWDPFAEGGGSVGGSVGELGIVAAIASAVRGHDGRTLGVLYVDVREPGKSFGAAHERFVAVAASVLGPLVRNVFDLDLSEARRARAEAVEPGPRELGLWDILGTPSMEPLLGEVRSALRSRLNVLVLGPSGTGKTLLARALAHAAGAGPVVRATLGSSDDLNTITSELFGHVRGAFSGAIRRRVGLVEHADGGTLVLDEILNLPPHAQQLLLDLAQFGTFRPLGDDSAEPRRVSLRVIAATNGDLDAAMDAGTFRRDLYYRLAGHVLRLPPLRERKTDIPALAESLLRRLDPARAWHLSLGARRALVRAEHDWPGNVRELEATLARARSRALVASDDAEVIELAHLNGELGISASLPPEPRPVAPSGDLSARWAALEQHREQVLAEERAILVDALAEEDGVVSRVARRLGLPRTTLLHRLQLHDLSSGR